HDGTEDCRSQVRTLVFFVCYYIRREYIGATLRFARLFKIGAGDGDTSVIADVDLGAGLFGERANGGAALADHITDFLGVDLQREHARRELGELGTRAFDGLTHDVEDVQPAFAGLSQSDLHDFAGDALDLDVHLQGSDAVDRARHFEIHVAQVVFVAQDVGQHGEFATVLDQTHGHTGHVLRHGNASIHQGQAATADRRHRGRTVGFGDFRHYTDGVLEVFRRRQERVQCTLGETTVTDL